MRMAVMLKERLDCRPEAVWRALRSPTVMREVAGPWLGYASLEDGGFPATWQEGPHPVRVLAAGLLPLGEQEIAISLDTTTHAGVRIVRDAGQGTAGVPGVLKSWYHRMAVSPHPDDPAATLYRDRLEFDAGAATPAIWPGVWALWQWRGARIKQLAPGFDELPPEPEDEVA
jgi:hypothetical protein